MVYQRGEIGGEGKVEWIWVAEIDGVYYVAKGTFHAGQIKIGTAFEIAGSIAEYLQGKKNEGYSQIYSR